MLPHNIAALRAGRGMSQTELATAIGTSLNMMGKLERGDRELTSTWIEKIAAALEVEPFALFAPMDTKGGPAVRAVAVKEPANDDESVEIQNIDLAYGLGSTFADGEVNIDLLRFPRVWVESITTSPAALLTWTQGRGDSMLPTIDDGDLILLDRSQTKVKEQDALWAFTVGDTASIKRLRVKGDRYVILSDNDSVPPDEEPIDFVNIVARVVFVGKRK